MYIALLSSLDFCHTSKSSNVTAKSTIKLCYQKSGYFVLRIYRPTDSRVYGFTILSLCCQEEPVVIVACASFGLDADFHVVHTRDSFDLPRPA